MAAANSSNNIIRLRDLRLVRGDTTRSSPSSRIKAATPNRVPHKDTVAKGISLSLLLRPSMCESLTILTIIACSALVRRSYSVAHNCVQPTAPEERWRRRWNWMPSLLGWSVFVLLR
ncbi:hypothetical protein CONPUDRAFT_166982 [Coniophora puteana RWD-64-598 SS2]|uniref:Uncharacterized protein n=1 Tax=Coniophora puteana (strain RWD-64-598) TaxID=741705 RepID=A0A5M3MIW5_CONPW|nr:uncharacterized protein CONPUDRAFT_166982 [Coniophora puteana RWD-64-598 SS2]EIW79199.1 hypothetical protein CONPUDRAFT_166982 [Coniophora puteana RWD-64-598 SS2]